MNISEKDLKYYLNSILQLMDYGESIDSEKVHSNMQLLESILNELYFYSEVIKSASLLLLIEEVRCLVEHYLLNRYTVLSDRKLKKDVSKKIKRIKASIDSFSLDDCSVNVGYLKSCIRNVLEEIYVGTDIRNYDVVISRYTKLSSNLKALGSIVDSMDIIDEEVHFLNTFIDSKFLYLGIQKHRGNLKRIAESLLKDIGQ